MELLCHAVLARLGQIDECWPRAGCADYLVAATNRQAEIRPQSRSAFLQGLGFPDLLRASPLGA